MPNVPAAAAQAFQREDYFSAFGLERRFGLDQRMLENKFYGLSRVYHPDRFLALGDKASVRQGLDQSLEIMSFLNQAYSTLKNPETRRDYLIALEGVAATGPMNQAGTLPLELAEAWFELEERAGDITSFKHKLETEIEQQSAHLKLLEESFDISPRKETLQAIANILQTRQYLKSLEKAVMRE